MRLATPIPALVAACTLLGGCALFGTRSDPSTFFTLAPTEVPAGSPAASSDLALGLGPVVIPNYLDRPQLVIRVGPNELRLAEVARWGEPLREGLIRVLRHDLVAAAAARTVVLYPWTAAVPVKLAVAVDVLRFEPNTRGDAELVARWSVRQVPHGRVLTARESRIVEPSQGTGTGAEVAALSRALGALGREIAAAVREVGSESRG